MNVSQIKTYCTQNKLRFEKTITGGFIASEILPRARINDSGSIVLIKRANMKFIINGNEINLVKTLKIQTYGTKTNYQ
jgi:hypothetical protein